MIEIVLDGAPMGKERLRLNKFTETLYTPERTLTYEARLAGRAQNVMAGRPLLTGQLEIDLTAYFPIPKSKPNKWKLEALRGSIRPNKKPDIDNICKIACDGLNLVVWADDAEIVEARLSKWYSDRPRLVLKAWEIKNQGVFT